MSADFEAIRQAAATKADNATNVRSSSTRRGITTPRPSIRWLVPSYELVDQSDAWSEDYVLRYPFEVMVDKPGGQTLSEPIVIGLMRALQVEWRSGHRLGLDYVTQSKITTMEPGLSEYAETGFDGFRGVLEVTVDETLSTARVE